MELKRVDTMVEVNGKMEIHRMYLPLGYDDINQMSDAKRKEWHEHFIENVKEMQKVECNYVDDDYFYCEPCCHGHLKSPEYNYVMRKKD